MTEEQVTKAMLKWLLENQWIIVSYDFPQSGTGRSLHPNGKNESKNKNAIIPDIIAAKNNICIFVENKDRFYYPDFEKQHNLIIENDYSDAIDELLEPYQVRSIFFGIGLPTAMQKKISEETASLVHFILCVNEENSIEILYNPSNISFISS